VDIREIPKMLFAEFGVNEEMINDHTMLAETKEGFFIKWKEQYGRTELKAFTTRENADADVSDHFLWLIAGPASIGPWLHGRGEQMLETLTVHMSQRSYSLLVHVLPLTSFCTRVMLRACELVSELPIEVSTFWPGERQELPNFDDDVEKGGG
jgi:hypothetical protein